MKGLKSPDKVMRISSLYFQECAVEHSCFKPANF